MASSSSSSSSSSSKSTHRWKYDVFVSFRGEDIGKGFMDHLFSDFKRKGIHAFRKDDHLKKGEERTSEIYEAIEKSRFLVVIFSQNYASSTGCLNEILKIIKCKEEEEKEEDEKKERYEIRTIFYNVKPYMVRYQADCFKAAFKEHEASNKKEVPQWKEALTKVANLSGWDLQDKANGFESNFIDIISKEIFETLSHGPLEIAENLVGLHSHAEQMNLLRFVGSSKVHMVGIWGIGGVGKSTFARAIYNLLYIHFDSWSFCEDVRGVTKLHGRPHLQKQLLDAITGAADIKIHSVAQGISVIKQQMKFKQVLIVLDDVDDCKQLEAVAGKDDWFWPGSLIIVTGRDRQLLKAHGVEEIYKVDVLNNDEALELFNLHAFKQKQPKKEFERLAHAVVQYARGHPQTLEVLGRFLFNKPVREWESELNKLQMIPNAEILKVFKRSYEGLDKNQKKIFLDIACFFKGEDRDFVTKILDGCDLFPDTNIRVLVDKLLITISEDGQLQLYDLIQQMGLEIVREESEEPAERSRLWFPEEVCTVLNKNKGTEAIQGMVLDLSSSKVNIGSQTFAKMNNLRLLKLHYGCLDVSNVDIKQNHTLQEVSKVGCSGVIEFLSNDLRWLCWHGYPFEFLPSTFFPESLVILDMSYSRIKQLWTGTKGLKKLTQMKLRHCRNLIDTPDFTQFPNLEELILEGCTNLVEIHPSVGTLKRLIVLNLANCKNLRNFPSIVEMELLKIFILSNCSKVDKLPDDLWKIKTLVELHIDGTALKQLPSSIESLNNLQALSLGRCLGIPSKSWSWPFSLLRKTQHPTALVVPSLSGLVFLRFLDVSHCNLSGPSLNDICCLSLLEELNLSGNGFATIPSSFGQLSGLKKLGLVGCKNLQELPELPSTIELVDAVDCTSMQELTKPSIMHKRNDLFFVFANCAKLVENQTIEGLVSMLLPQGCFDSYGDFSLLLSGCVIPKWFTNQSMGDCVRVELPPQWSSCKLKGFAIAAVFTPTNLNCCKAREIGVLCHVRSFDCISATDFGIRTKIFPNEIRSIQSDQIWLSFWTSGAASIKVKDYIDLSFETCGIDGEVKQCGLRLLYDEDEGESSSGMIQWLSPSNEAASALHPILDQSAAIEEGPPLAESHV